MNVTKNPWHTSQNQGPWMFLPRARGREAVFLPRPAQEHGFSPSCPREEHPRALVLGRVPWIFGYVHYPRMDLSCIICFVWPLEIFSPCFCSYRNAIIPS